MGTLLSIVKLICPQDLFTSGAFSLNIKHSSSDFKLQKLYMKTYLKPGTRLVELWFPV